MNLEIAVNSSPSVEFSRELDFWPRESNMIGSVIMANTSPQFLAGHLYNLSTSNRSYLSYH